MLLIDHDANGVAHITMNRPERHNAFDEAMVAALADAFRSEAVAGARAVLLSGEGLSFSAGADADWMRRAADWSEEANARDAQALSDMLWAIDCCPAPVIAVVHGHCLGGGVGLIACCDMVAANTQAVFGFSEVRLGITPATISPFVLRAIGPRQARRLFLTGERFGAADALELGLVHGVSDDPEHLAEDWLDALARGAPGAIREAKALVRDIAGQPITDAIRAETAARIARRRTTDEAREGMAAFLARRAPGWASRR